MNPLVGLALAWLVFGRKSPIEEAKETDEMPSIVALSVPGHFLRSDAARAFEQAVSATSVPRVTSSFRTRAQQEALYALYLAGKGNLAAKPGTSLHEVGLAIDARGAPDWEEAMSAAGFVRTVKSEPWHWEFRT